MDDLMKLIGQVAPMLIAGVFGAAVGVGSACATIWAHRKKVEADTGKAEADTDKVNAEVLILILGQMKELNAQLVDANNDRAKLMLRVAELVAERAETRRNGQTSFFAEEDAARSREIDVRRKD